MFNIEKREDSKLEAMYDKAMKELDVFFEINWTETSQRFNVVKDRALLMLYVGSLPN